ncbi:MAG: PAS/PAC sensor signal transduction histidine kinase [uncultured bacterium]|nr:MAG: PAS/PAC sensor signal transduction histidine kinase [uncultured bacterium]
MSPNQQNDSASLPFAWWLPYTVSGVGIALSIVIWYALVDDLMMHSIKHSYPWIILTLGVSIAILVGFAIRLIQLTHQRRKSLELVNEHFKKEIADRIHAEETKQKLEKALLQGQKLQAIGTLAGGIAHDFNNILYAIIGYVEMSREDVPKNNIIHKNLGKVLDACKRGQDLVARILAFSRRQHHDFKPLHIRETIEGILGLLKPTIPASVDIRLQSMIKDCTILGDQTQLHQVIVNIINNAVDAMDGEGAIHITLNRIAAHDEALYPFPHIAKDLSYCKIDIIDTGHGMDQSTIERIFEPFYTTKEVGKGTGLGLSTAHSIVKEHQGEILVESRLGHGAKFTLLLPEHEGE